MVPSRLPEGFCDAAARCRPAPRAATSSSTRSWSTRPTTALRPGCADGDCAGDPICAERCDDGADNDADGFADCADEDCWTAPGCACTAAGELGCGEEVEGTTREGVSQLERYGCAPEWEEAGADAVYRFVSPVSDTVTLRRYGSAPLDLFVLEAACDAASCVARDEDGDGAVSFPATAGAEYFLVVDGWAGLGGGDFGLELACAGRAEADCADGADDDADGFADCDDPDCWAEAACESWCSQMATPIVCFETVAGSTVGKDDHFSGYECSGFPETGGDLVFEYRAEQDMRVEALIESGIGVDLDLFLFGSACDDGPCLDGGGNEVTFQARAGNRYYLVVDGYQGDSGAFDLTVICENFDTELFCDDGLDNDHDEATDCVDSDCRNAAACLGALCTPDTLVRCGDTWSDTSVGEPNELTTYPNRATCPAEPLYGGERVYRFLPEATTEVTLALPFLPLFDVRLVVLEEACGATRCVATATDTLTFTARAGAGYYLVVDSPLAGGPFELERRCE